jgi:hypothetical protein
VTVAGGKALQADVGAVPVNYTVATFTDAAVETKFLLNMGEGQVLLRGYMAGLKADGTITLSRNQVAVSTNVVELISNDWATVKLQIVGTNIQVSVNDVVIIDYTETALLPSGTAGFSASNGSILRVDDFAVYGVPTEI